MTDEDEYTQQLDREAVAQARRPWPDLSKVRRVRIPDGDQPRAMAHAANDDREREGATE